MVMLTMDHNLSNNKLFSLLSSILLTSPTTEWASEKKSHDLEDPEAVPLHIVSGMKRVFDEK